MSPRHTVFFVTSFLFHPLNALSSRCIPSFSFHFVSVLVVVPLFQLSSISIEFRIFKYIPPLSYVTVSLRYSIRRSLFYLLALVSLAFSPRLVVILIFIPIYTPTSLRPFHFVFLVSLVTRELQLHCNSHFHPRFTLQLLVSFRIFATILIFSSFRFFLLY